MGANQIAKMEPSLREIYKGISGPDDPPALCCTMEAINLSGSRLWVQSMPGTVNMAYLWSEEPLEVLRAQGVRSPLDLYLVEWAAGEYATFGFAYMSPRDHATFIDQLYVKVLNCDDATYEVNILVEPLETE
jgi:hypothetical protein